MNEADLKTIAQIELDNSNKAQYAFDTYFQDFFSERESNIINAIRTIGISEVDQLRSLHLMLKALVAIKSDLLTKITTGKLAQMELTRIQSEETTNG